jgi:hypothetical protein
LGLVGWVLYSRRSMLPCGMIVRGYVVCLHNNQSL